MLGRIAAAAALIALMGCAGVESAGRNASRSPQSTRVASAPAPAPTTRAPAPVVTPSPTPAPVVTAAPPPQVAAPTPAPRVVASAPPPVAAPATPPPVQRTQAAPPPAQPDRPVRTAANDEENVVVPGVRERQVQAPNGDPRSNAERMEDIRSWDRCVMRAQGAAEADPLSPQLETPEDYCRESLGMTNRNSIPASRLERR